ncbi:MAG: tRNA pseudouridine(38-40) synthase TruA [Butyrivibrio sp.]|nr:tRNA pseudouridine(38-40) synthase TruA [Butyrivibrio sp.]
MRVMLRVAYDGTAYSGWQLQPNAVTIEQRLNEALRDLFGVPISVIGASRTDAGVHALDNAAVFDAETRMPASKIAYALNTRLPEDIRIMRSAEVPSDFHPRHTDCVKTYEYKIWNDTFPNPTVRLYSHFEYGAIDVERMTEAAQYLVGEHDFTSFCSAGSQVENKVRSIFSVDIKRVGAMITVRTTGNGFLYNMVRIIAGTLLKVGQGAMEPRDVQKALDGRDRRLAGPTAPARGLTLVKIDYGENF